MSDARYNVTFYDEQGERIWGGRCHWVYVTKKGEVVPDEDYREVQFENLYAPKTEDPFFRRAMPEGDFAAEVCCAISTDDFDEMTMTVYDS